MDLPYPSGHHYKLKSQIFVVDDFEVSKDHAAKECSRQIAESDMPPHNRPKV